jgi:hypothetical protein
LNAQKKQSRTTPPQKDMLGKMVVVTHVKSLGLDRQKTALNAKINSVLNGKTDQ